MEQVYLIKGGRVRLVEEGRVEYWKKQGFEIMKRPQPKKAKPQAKKAE